MVKTPAPFLMSVPAAPVLIPVVLITVLLAPPMVSARPVPVMPPPRVS